MKLALTPKTSTKIRSHWYVNNSAILQANTKKLVPVFASLLEYAAVGYLMKRMRMRRERKDSSAGMHYVTLSGNSSTYSTPLHKRTALTMSNDMGVGRARFTTFKAWAMLEKAL